MQGSDPVADALAARSRRRRPTGAPVSLPLLTGLRAFDSVDDESARVGTGDLVSIVGASHSGKTQLLYALLAGAVAPSPAGRQSHAVYFELLEQLNTNRVAVLIRDRIECSLQAMEMDQSHMMNLDEQISKSLSRIRVYRVSSTKHLCVTLNSIERLLSTRDGTEIDMICIDGLGAMHYVDKLEKDTDAREDVLVHAVKRVLSAYRSQIFVAVTECALYDDVRIAAIVAAAKEQRRAAHEVPTRPASTMPREWSDLITHTVALYISSEDLVPIRGALVLHSRSHWQTPSLVTAGELLLDENVVALRQQSVLSASAGTVTDRL